MSKPTSATDMMWVVAVSALAALLVWVAIKSHGHNAAAAEFGQSRMEIKHSDGTASAFTIETALTREQQEQGLMFRKTLAPDSGMLFLWQQDQPVQMWMKNTLIPLDMLFIADNGQVVKIIANAVPYDLTPLSSDGPVKGVIEIGGGEAAKQKIVVGDHVTLPGADAPAPQ